ncbi:MTOR-associated protein MEAK7-like [Aquarana catesbeiana]|uniref:MTOR-associated protein MEAK7-like n=1 Tax=Aquarana catesbeiana TaxID=8400 RepID=UPI003CC9CBB3
MCRRIFRGMQSSNPTGKAVPPAREITEEQFTTFIVYILRGTAEEKGALITSMIIPNKETVKREDVQEFLEDLICGVINALLENNATRGWRMVNTRNCKLGSVYLAVQLLSQLHLAKEEEEEEEERHNSYYPQASIMDWLCRTPLVSVFLRITVTMGLSVLQNSTEQQQDLRSLIPTCKMGNWADYCSLLDFPSIIFLNYHLPAEMQHRWRLLFSTLVYGRSFIQLCTHLVDKGPTLLVLRDTNGFIFGGFASPNWEVKPQIQGDSRCFLFTVFPKFGIYTCTGCNGQYMYLNHGIQADPKGLGMGGYLGCFGLWIDQNFRNGHSKAKPLCTTYNSPRLSAREDFTIDCMEVWQVGNIPEQLQVGRRNPQKFSSALVLHPL